MEDLAGVISFTTAGLVSEEEKPYIPVSCDVSLKALSQFILDKWQMQAPDVMISIVTGVSHFKEWPEDYTIALQNGLTKVMNTSEAWLLTHGFDTGVVKLVGEAVRNELDKRAVYKPRDVRRFNKRISQLTLIGICADFLINELEALQNGEPGSWHGYGSNLDLAEDRGIKRGNFNLNPFHTHYVIVKGSTSKTIREFRTDLEKELQRFSSVRRHFGNVSAEKSGDETGPQECDSNIFRMGVPLVALVIQGGPFEILQIWTYLRNRTPVVIVKGSGLVADLFAYIYEEIALGADLERDWLNIVPEIRKRLVSMFPRMQETNEEKDDCCNKLLDCMRLATNGELNYITILDLTRASSDLADLDLYILRAIFASQKSTALDLEQQAKRDLTLALQWNRADFAREKIFPYLRQIKVHKDVFRLALIRKNRADFVDVILRHGFRTHEFLSHFMLIDLFRSAENTDFFTVNVLETLLGYPPESKVDEKFLLEDLNWIVTALTRVEHFVNFYELSTNSCGVYSTSENVAERKSLNALILWSVLMGRIELTKVFWKYVQDPVPTAIFVSAIWHGLSTFCREPEVANQTRDWGKSFGVMGMDILNMAYKESLDRAFDLLDTEFPDFGRRTPVQLAYDANNRQFIAHSCCQKWINKIYMGHIQIATALPGSIHVPEFIKILLSAFLIFPMFFWIYFPSLDSREAESLKLETESLRPRAHSVIVMNLDSSRRSIPNSSGFSDVDNSVSMEHPLMAVDTMKKTWLVQLQDDQDAARDREARRRFLRRIFFGTKARKRNFATLCERVNLMWTSPVTKFWTFQFFYWMYLLLFSVGALLPDCDPTVTEVADDHVAKNMSGPHHRHDDFTISPFPVIHALLWIWTALIAAETFYRNYRLFPTLQINAVLTKLLEMSFMLGFLIAYFVVRVISLESKLFSPFATRILMCIGLIYFSYRLIGVFFPMSDTLGPMLVRMKYMLGVDFLNYMKMIVPFMLAGGVIIQVVLYPDKPLTLEVLRQAFHRAFFTLFTFGPIQELQHSVHCEGTRWTKHDDREYCRAGEYADNSCANVTFWSYISVIQYMVILRLVLATLLSALFTATQLRIASEADSIWKFKRYSVVMEFATRPPVPPPLSIFYYVCQGLRYLCRCLGPKHKTKMPKEHRSQRVARLRALRQDDYHYWKSLVREFFRQKEKTKREEATINRCLDKLTQVHESLGVQSNGLNQLKDRMAEMETMMASVIQKKSSSA